MVLKLTAIGWALAATLWTPSGQSPAVLNGRAAASFAYLHVFDASPGTGDPRTALAIQAMTAGGWTLPAAANADTLATDLAGRKGVSVREIAPGSPDVGSLAAVPGDLLVADWGEGDEKAPAEKNRATGAASEFMVVQGGLGGGDFVYCRNSGSGRAQMGRFQSLLHSPSLAQARYRLFHVVGNDPTYGLKESTLYRDENHLGVFIQINGGLFWLRDDAQVKAFGGWDKLNTLPRNTISRQNEVPVTGTMVRELNDVGVWMIEGNIRRHVRTDAGVRRLGGWEAVRTVPDGCIDFVLPHEGHAIL